MKSAVERHEVMVTRHRVRVTPDPMPRLSALDSAIAERLGCSAKRPLGTNYFSSDPVYIELPPFDCI